MEPRADKKNSPAERWYLRVQGRTIGPLAQEEIRFGLETGEFLPADRVASSRHPAWSALAEHEQFRGFARKENALRSDLLVAPPPPQLLRARAQPVPPPIPEVIPKSPAPKALAPLQKEFAAIPQKFRNAEKLPEGKVLYLRNLPDAPKPVPAPQPVPELIAKPISIVTAASVPALAPSPIEEVTEDAETNLSLDAATKELERFLSSLKKSPVLPKEPIAAPARKSEMPSIEKPVFTAPIPARPSYEPVFFGATAAPAVEKKKTEGRVLRIELKLPETLRQWLLLLAAIALAAAAYLYAGSGKKSSPELDDAFGEIKTRDLKDSRLSDPSSPTNRPLEAGDPVPPLKAPTRPQRE